jgi:hypothetical protein
MPAWGAIPVAGIPGTGATPGGIPGTGATPGGIPGAPATGIGFTAAGVAAGGVAELQPIKSSDANRPAATIFNNDIQDPLTGAELSGMDGNSAGIPGEGATLSYGDNWAAECVYCRSQRLEFG